MTADDQNQTPLTDPFREYDVVVVGAGPAGIAAACVAAEQGARVGVVEASPSLGGQIWHGETATRKDPAAKSWLQRLRHCGAEILCGATVFATGKPKSLWAETPRAAVEIGWKRLVLATGARELMIPLPGWTLPGVVGAGGLQAMSKGGWPISGKRVVVAGSGPLLLAVADGLKQQGAIVVAIVEQAPRFRVVKFGLQMAHYPAKLCQGLAIKLRLLTTPYHCGCWPVEADGDGRVGQVVLSDGTRRWTVACDYLACGFGLVPNTELAQLLGCQLQAGFVKIDRRQETSVPDVFCAGEPTGIGGADRALVEGQIAGLHAAGAAEQASRLEAQRLKWQRFSSILADVFALRPELSQLTTPDTIVCRCEDIRRRQIEPFASWREAKLQTRCGMGACQGRICGTAISVVFGWKHDSVRPPIVPVRLGSLISKGNLKS
jgi:NADPH-dependent 2,4-dienoyl-CoA reductase/sulfur reductase-like enzyme